MKRFALVFCMLAPITAHAQTAGKAPFDFTFGPQDDGTFGAILKGNHYFSLDRRATTRTSGSLVSLFAGLDVDGSWNSDPQALNSASISIKPSFAVQKLRARVIGNDTVPTTRGPWLHIFFDGRQRFGHFKDAGADEVRRVNQLILGGGIQYRLAGFPDWWAREFATGRLDNVPTFTIAYYTIGKNVPEREVLPNDITADAIIATAQTSLTLPIQCTETPEQVVADPNDPFSAPGTVIHCPWGFVGEVVGTKLTNGSKAGPDFRIDIGVFYDAGGSFKPILRYRSGEEHGLEYDRQFIFGLLWELPIRR